eukprot:INCI1014.1.p1 GENE.INCI1014.1~~INCI1014.1.p1  ORF type:complete len:493 (-),score=129.12 INCI1014.1:154-1632(-)
MNVELHVTYQDATRLFKFPFSDFPMVTIRHLKQIIGEAFGAEKGTHLRIFRAVSPDPPPESTTPSKQLFEELANNGTFHDYGINRGDLLVASDQPLAVPQKNLVADEMDRTIHLFHWVPPAGKTIMQMQADIREVFESFGSIYRVILSSISPSQEEFTAIITFDTPDAAKAAAAAMQSPAIVKALQEVTLLNKDIAVFTAVRDHPAPEKEAQEEKSDTSVESSDAKNAEEASGSGTEAATNQGPSESRSSLDDAVAMAKSQLIHGYLDGRQGVALIAWTAEPVPLRALMGRAASAPVGQRVKAAAKIVGTRVQGAAKNALRWFKRTTTKEKMNAVKAKVAATARGVQADLKIAAKVVASTAARAKDKVQAKLAKKSSNDTSGPDGNNRVDDRHPDQNAVPLHESSASSTRSERQEYFLQQAAAQASRVDAHDGSSGSNDRENDTAGDEEFDDASGPDDDDADDVDHVADDNDEDEDEDSKRNPPPNLTFDDI